jgi:hypothetical protein
MYTQLHTVYRWGYSPIRPYANIICDAYTM